MIGRRVVGGLMAAGLALTLAGPAAALRVGTTAGGIGWQAGGVTFEERSTMQLTASSYSLWVVTAAVKSGAFLADAQITIRDEAGVAVFDHRVGGPWLYVDLPPGRYTVQARLGGTDQQRSTSIRQGDHHQMLFYFATGDEVGGTAAPAPPAASALR